MSHFDYKQFYERKRPHIHPPGATLFLTFRLAGSIPQSTLRECKARRKWMDDEIRRIERNLNPREAEAIARELTRNFHRQWFGKFEDILHEAKHGPLWLAQPEIRQIVCDKMIEDDGKKYRLDAFSIMSNHVHSVFKPFIDDANLVEDRRSGRSRFLTDEETLAQIMQSIKGVTAREANKVLGRRGSLWETESYDHYVRDAAEFERIVKYTLNNPVKAGLVKHWSDWPGNYMSDKLQFVGAR